MTQANMIKRTILAGAALALILPLSATAAGKPGDWASYGYGEDGAKYSPLAQITPANVGKLAVAWTYHMNPNPAAGPTRVNSTTTPLMVDGKMFLGTPYGRVVALDPASGAELWSYQMAAGDQPAFRGLGYWAGDKGHAPRLIFGTLRGNIVALDAATGKPSAGFGTNGVVDTKTPEIMNGFPDALYSYSSPPSIYKNVAIFGSRLSEAGSKGPRGDARAWDVVTGKLLWTFKSIPDPGEPFHETWTDDGWKQRTGVNQWNMSTVDTARGIAYLTFGDPTFDRYGGDRKGDNLFSASVVAVDATTGKYLWHFQTVHHGIWDYDLHTPPTLLTVKKDGKTIPAVAVMNKTAFLFLLDRVTGKPIYDVTEIPVPPGTAPDEQASPTQPFPTKPGVLTRMSFDMSELAQITPEHTAACAAVAAKDGGAVGSKMFEPLRADKPQVRFPGGAGGPEWGGMTFDPKNGLLIFGANQIGYLEKLVKTANGDWSMTGGRFVDPKTRNPCQKTPWGELIAINVNTGDVAWRSILGVTDNFPEGKQNTGRAGNGGPISTAGGVTFIGGTDDQRFRAFETKTGKELWTYKFDYSAHANPMTYQGKDGRQYVAIVSTGGSYLGSPTGGDSLVAFALPK
jgi:quinoprotein glucose dehydrogenase